MIRIYRPVELYYAHNSACKMLAMWKCVEYIIKSLLQNNPAVHIDYSCPGSKSGLLLNRTSPYYKTIQAFRLTTYALGPRAVLLLNRTSLCYKTIQHLRFKPLCYYKNCNTFTVELRFLFFSSQVSKISSSFMQYGKESPWFRWIWRKHLFKNEDGISWSIINSCFTRINQMSWSTCNRWSSDSVCITSQTINYFDSELTDGQTIIRIVGFDENHRDQLETFFCNGQPVTLQDCQIQYNKFKRLLWKVYTKVELSNAQVDVADINTVGAEQIALARFTAKSEYNRVTVQAQVVKFEDPLTLLVVVKWNRRLQLQTHQVEQCLLCWSQIGVYQMAILAFFAKRVQLKQPKCKSSVPVRNAILIKS